MSKKDITTSIRKYRADQRRAEVRAVKYIATEDYAVAILALTEAETFKGIIAELEFQLECMEVE